MMLAMQQRDGAVLFRVELTKRKKKAHKLHLEVKFTLPKTNIAPTNGWLEYYFPIGEAYFQGLR